MSASRVAQLFYLLGEIPVTQEAVRTIHDEDVTRADVPMKNVALLIGVLVTWIGESSDRERSP